LGAGKGWHVLATSTVDCRFPGAAAGILGRWTIKEKLQAVDWQAPRAPAADKVAALKASLGSEQDLTVPAPPALGGTISSCVRVCS
jgi:hypothetical protein